MNEFRLDNTRHNIRITNEHRLKAYAESDRISQVLINLLTNAIKYCPGRDTVDVRIFRDGDFAAVSVHDMGIGISKKDQEKIFERFYRAADENENNFWVLGSGCIWRVK